MTGSGFLNYFFVFSSLSGDCSGYFVQLLLLLALERAHAPFYTLRGGHSFSLFPPGFHFHRAHSSGILHCLHNPEVAGAALHIPWKPGVSVHPLLCIARLLLECGASDSAYSVQTRRGGIEE